MRLLLFSLLMFATVSHAAVYKCLLQGRLTYTDRPCDAAAQPATLPPVTAIQKSASDDLGKSHDERLSRERKSRDQADAAFLKSHAERSAREKAVRAAIIDHRVIEGMTGSEVDSALGSPDEVLPDGTRRYRRDGQRISIRFRQGAVSGISITTDSRKK